jgi:aspartate aminotransferase
MYEKIDARLQASPTLGAAETVRRLESQGKSVVRFDIGEPDFDTPNHIKDAAIKAIKDGFTHYTSPRGLRELREALATSYAERGARVESEEVVFFPGSKFALFSSLSLLIDPGDEVILQDPSWPSYCSMITFLRGTPVHVPVDDDQRFVPTIDSFAEKITKRTRAIIVNSPGNPTGSVYPERLLKELLELCERHNIVLISDEIYSSLIYDGKTAPSPLQDPEAGTVIVVSGFSKEFAMTGWRLGYSIASERFTDLLVRVQENTTTCPTSFVQKAALAALTEPRDWFRDMLAEYRVRRDTMVREISKVTGWRCLNPDGAFYCFPRTNFEDSRAFENSLLDNKLVSVVAGAHFGQSGEGHIRLSYATSKENILRGMGLIRQYVDERSN